MENDKAKKVPVYEKLAPGEVLIISKDEENGCLEVAENVDGKVKYRKVCSTEE